MKEITGELWDYFGRPYTVVLVTTNGTVKKNGEAVMGRGCAFEAKRKFPAAAAYLGDHIRRFGNRVSDLGAMLGLGALSLWTFPVKHNWYEPADLELIQTSAQTLRKYAEETPEFTWILPRPGCGNGRLTWEQVKPGIEFLPDNVWMISK